MAVSACELIVVVESLSNAPLILGLLIYFSHIWHKAFHDPAADWRLRLLEIAQARHIDLTACRVPMCLPEFVKEMKEERRPVDPKWRRVDWPSMVRNECLFLPRGVDRCHGAVVSYAN